MSASQNVPIRPSPPISVQENSDVEIADESYVYAKVQPVHKPEPIITRDSNQSPQSTQSEKQKKSTSKKVSISANSADICIRMPPNQFYYQVVAKFNYSGQDEDELDLKKEDVIMVLPWENDDQQVDFVIECAFFIFIFLLAFLQYLG